MIKYQNVNLTIDNIDILKDINLELEKGDIIHILGPNGGGKTTLIKILTGLLKPTSGKVLVEVKNVGYLPQHLQAKKAFPATVFEVIYSGFKKQHLIPSKNQIKIIDEWLEKMNMSNFKYKNIGDLSGGERQRVYLIRALINDPDLLILDEPTSALDPNFRQVFYKIIDSLNQKGTTIINITHDLDPNYLSCNHHVLYVDRMIKFDGKYCDYHTQFGDEESHV